MAGLFNDSCTGQISEKMDIIGWVWKNGAQLYAAGSLILVFVWVFYAHIFYRDFKSRHYPRIMIQQSPDNDLDSVCLVINMSQHIINISSIYVIAETPQNKVQFRITDYRRFSSDDYAGQKLKYLLKQGPLESGAFTLLGTFKDLVSKAAQSVQADEGTEQTEEKITRLEIRVIFFSGAESKPVAARRGFIIRRDGGRTAVHPEIMNTDQMDSFRQRKIARRWFDESA